MEKQIWQRVRPTGAHNKKGIFLEQVVGYPEESNRTAVFTEEPVHGKVGHGGVQWCWESGVLIIKQLLSCQEASSTGDTPETCYRKHSTEGCIHPGEQENQSTIGTCSFLSTGIPV